MKGIIRIQTQKQFQYYLAMKVCEWESFLDDIKYYKWETTINNRLHPLLSDDINFNNLLCQIQQCQKNCGIILRKFEILSQIQFLQAKKKTQQFLITLQNFQQHAIKTRKKANEAVQFIAKNQNY